MKRHILILLTLIALFAQPVGVAFAQDATPVAGPIYLVQSGDNLTSIANQFGISTDELISANGITDPNALKIGDELIIPGLQGIQGYLVTQRVGFGNTLDQLSILYQIPAEMLTRLNNITSPAELYAGVNLILPQQQEFSSPSSRFLLAPGQSLLEFAVLANSAPWQLQAVNHLNGSWNVVPGQSIYLPVSAQEEVKGLVSDPLDSIDLSPLPLIQGRTETIQIKATQPLEITGSLTDHTLHFMPDGENQYVTLQGIHAMQDPGIYPLQLQVKLQDGTSLNLEQMVIIQDGYYPRDPIINVKDEFIDPSVTLPELEWLVQQTSVVTPEKMWQGQWISPSPYSYQECLNSRYGNRRSYNGGPFENFHSGVDFCGGDGVKIFAPAAGKVVFAGPLTVRGNATIIDHGWGVYSGYWHQTTIGVAVGDVVEQGQEIGLVGSTGRVTGAHLHWEVWAGGVQVNPLLWLEFYLSTSGLDHVLH